MPLRIGSDLPQFNGATEWLGGTKAQVEADTRGKPTLVHFWATSCGICKENLSVVSAWRDKFRHLGLRVIAIHMPRYESDTDVEAVRQAIATHNLTEPCAVDNEHKLREIFQNDQGYVPAYYLFDAEGKLRSFAAGERGLELLKSALERVLAQTPAAIT